MALDLKIGEQVGLPPAGEKSLILDADGDPFLLTSDGTREELGGGSDITITGTGEIDVDDSDPEAPIISPSDALLSPWDRTAIARARAIYEGFTGFNRQRYGLGRLSSTTAPAVGGALEGGSVKTQATGARVFLADSYCITSPKALPWYMQVQAKLVLPASGSDALYFGAVDAGATQFIVMSIDFAIHATRWNLQYTNGTPVAVNSLVDGTTDLCDLALYFDGAKVGMALNGTEMANTTNLTNIPAVPLCPYIVRINTVPNVTISRSMNAFVEPT